MIKPRDFQLDAWEMARRHGQPGDVAVIKKGMEWAYGIGLKDATEELAELRKKIAEDKERSNAPR